MRCWQLLSLALLGVASCGIQDHPWAASPVDPSGAGTGGVTPDPTGAAGTIGGTGSGGITGSGSGGSSGLSGSGGTSGGTGGTTGGTGGTLPVADGGTAADGPPVGLPANGVPVAKERMIGFVHFGHSNMAGRGENPSTLRPFFFETTPRAWMYHIDKKWELVREPFSGGDSTSLSRNSGGPGTALVKTAAAMAPAYNFVSVGYGKNSAYCSQYVPGAIYNAGMMAAIKDLKGKITFGAIFIMLGITERHGTAADRSGYATCINRLATMIRDEVGVPNLPVLLTDYEVTGTGEFVVGGAVERAIRPQILMVPSVVANSALVPTNNLNLADDHHFELDGHKIWAERAIQIMNDKGWFPWK